MTQARAFVVTLLLALAASLAAPHAVLAKSTPPKTLPNPEPRPSAPDQPKAAGASCELDAASKDPQGFYPKDAFPKGEVVLTFDDGPHPSATPKVLDLLAKHGFKATFFLVGHNISAKTYPLVQRMIAEGHTLGSHTYNHDVKMSVRLNGERSIEYIRGGHVATQVLIEIALMAQSEADFDSMFTRVFQEKPGTYLSGGALRKDWRSFEARHLELLAERGYRDGKRPYPIVYSRPPAGTPYVGLSSAAEKHLYTTALERLGWLNVMWHGESGDTNAAQKYDFAYLTANLEHHSKRGGVILIHDYIRKDALTTALARMAKDPAVHVVPIESAVRRKFGCDGEGMRAELSAGAAGQGHA